MLLFSIVFGKKVYHHLLEGLKNTFMTVTKRRPNLQFISWRNRDRACSNYFCLCALFCPTFVICSSVFAPPEPSPSRLRGHPGAPKIDLGHDLHPPLPPSTAHRGRGICSPGRWLRKPGLRWCETPRGAPQRTGCSHETGVGILHERRRGSGQKQDHHIFKGKPKTPKRCLLFWIWFFFKKKKPLEQQIGYVQRTKRTIFNQ